MRLHIMLFLLLRTTSFSIISSLKKVGFLPGKSGFTGFQKNSINNILIKLLENSFFFFSFFFFCLSYERNSNIWDYLTTDSVSSIYISWMFNLECSANDFLIKLEKQFKKSSRMYFGFNLLDHRGKQHLY